MRKTAMIFFLVPILVAVSSVGMAKDCRLTTRQIDVYLNRLENALPVLEKQASIIAGLLQNDKDLEEIRLEFNRFQGYTDLPGERTLLYKEIQPFKPNDDFILIGKNYIPLYSLEILHDLTNGGCYGTISYDTALRDTSPRKWIK